MSQPFRYAAIGAAAGAVTGILGSGGGLVLVPLLSAFCAEDEATLFPRSLSIMLPICVCSLLVQYRASPPPLPGMLPYLIGGALGFHREAGTACVAASIFWTYSALEWIQMPFFITLALSTVLGLLSGLGVGGGSLLILWLTLVCKIDYPVAKYMNLLFFLLPALISTAVHFIQRKLSAKHILPAAAAGCVTAAVFTLLSGGWDTDILTAIRELRYKKQQRGPSA